jgi:hypothetical protein
MHGDDKLHNSGWEPCRERGHLRDIGIEGKIILKFVLKEQGMRMWTELIWIRIEFSGGLLWNPQVP